MGDSLSLQRLLESTFKLDFAATRKYCLADDRFLDLCDGAGWELLQTAVAHSFGKRIDVYDQDLPYLCIFCTKRTTEYAADIFSIFKARTVIKPHVHTTPVKSSETLNSMAGKTIFFKCECFQKSGAFKFRGATNAVFSLGEEAASQGVVTHSSGNHATALSLAAKLRGIPAYVVVPEIAPKCKIENVKRYGGNVTLSEANMQSRNETANKVVHETGAVLIPSSNHGHIISGQGTVSLEFLDQVSQLDTLIVPISGGGLISGVAIGAKSMNPAIRVVAAEPTGADDAAQSKAAGRIITLNQTNTIADGLRASLGDLTWPIVRVFVDDIVTVEDHEITQAMRYCYEILKVAIEPSGAIGLAAVLSDNFKQSSAWKDSQNIGIVLSGGNVDLSAYARSCLASEESNHKPRS